MAELDEQKMGDSPAAEEFSLEDNFEKIEEILAVLEREDVSLEQAFAAYSKGVLLVKECNAQIDRVEKKVQLLTENGELETFD